MDDSILSAYLYHLEDPVEIDLPSSIFGWFVIKDQNSIALFGKINGFSKIFYIPTIFNFSILFGRMKDYLTVKLDFCKFFSLIYEKCLFYIFIGYSIFCMARLSTNEIWKLHLPVMGKFDWLDYLLGSTLFHSNNSTYKVLQW